MKGALDLGMDFLCLSAHTRITTNSVSNPISSAPGGISV